MSYVRVGWGYAFDADGSSGYLNGDGLGCMKGGGLWKC